MKQPILNHWTDESPVFESHLPKVINYKFDLIDGEACPFTADFGYTEASHQEMCYSFKARFKLINCNTLVSALTNTATDVIVKTITKDPDDKMFNFAATVSQLINDVVKGHGNSFVLIGSSYLINMLWFKDGLNKFDLVRFSDLRVRNSIFIFKNSPVFDLHLSLPIDADGLQGQHIFNIPKPIAELVQQPIAILNVDFGFPV